ncbi:MAG: hypothetical protein P0116_12990 [Candidatus Nitrosocosmicus sp.]|nr:hypothetical protein [Candidatus Nitrosocosmicus sp.]
MDGNKTVIDEFKNQRANDGTGQFTYKFDTPGEKYFQITLESHQEDLGMFVESATFMLCPIAKFSTKRIGSFVFYPLIVNIS